MALPVKKECIFCGGTYVKLRIGHEPEKYRATTIIMNEIGTKEVQWPVAVIYLCETCGNIQSFLEKMPDI